MPSNKKAPVYFDIETLDRHALDAMQYAQYAADKQLNAARLAASYNYGKTSFTNDFLTANNVTVRWLAEDIERAAEEGWRLAFGAAATATGRTTYDTGVRLEPLDDRHVNQIRAHVRNMAILGSGFHIRALMIIARTNPAEFVRVIKCK